MNLDIRDIEILYTLYSNNAISAFQSLTVKKMMEISELDFSYYSFLRSLRVKLLPMGFAKDGYKIGNSKTFFITELGVEYLKENIIKDEESLYELHEISDEEEKEILAEDVNITYDAEHNVVIYEEKNNYLSGGKNNE